MNSFVTQVSRDTPATSAAVVLAVGATNLRNLNLVPEILRGIRNAYCVAISNTLLLAAVAAGIAIPLALCMEWKNVKREGSKRREMVMAGASDMTIC